MNTKIVKIGEVEIGGGRHFCLIAGLCIIENEELTFSVAKKLIEITTKLKIPFVFKASFDKANRLSVESFRGLGIERGLEILANVKNELKVPVLTDVHEAIQVERAAKVADVLQIPAFLCRQTDLLITAARTKKPINIKKGQFLAPENMKNLIKKALSVGNDRVLVTERGASFGYGNLVVDMTSLAAMRKFGFPVVFDATHSVQQPGGEGKTSGGKREFVPALARAAAAVGIDALFLEVYPNPSQAKSDQATSLYLEDLESVLKPVKRIDNLFKSNFKN